MKLKYLLLGASLFASSLMAEVTTITPYAGTIDYSAKSSKDKASLMGVHYTVGTLDYLIEADYSHFNASYNDSTSDDLKQDDFTLVYGKYYTDYMFRLGAHYINTNDDQLNNGIIFISTLGGYKYLSYDKLSYGVEGYYSYYKKGHDENYGEEKKIHILQISPYFSYYKSINSNMGNTFAVKTNYQIAYDYDDDKYFSYEVSDTLFYKDFFATLKAYGGEMRTGVKDSGMTIYNTLDLMKKGFDIKLGYTLNKNTTLSISYGENTYSEFNTDLFQMSSTDITSKVTTFSLNYSF